MTADSGVPIVTYARSTHSLVVGGHSVPLTRREWELINILDRARGKPLSAGQITLQLWGWEDHDARSNVRVLIKQIRAKAPGDSVVMSIGGEGYCLNPITLNFPLILWGERISLHPGLFTWPRRRKASRIDD